MFTISFAGGVFPSFDVFVARPAEKNGAWEVGSMCANTTYRSEQRGLAELDQLLPSALVLIE